MQLACCSRVYDAVLCCAVSSLHRLVVAEGGEDVTIKVSDEGGGIPRSGMPNIWTYLYSTAKQPVEVDKVSAHHREAALTYK